MKRDVNTPRRVRFILVLLLFFLAAVIGGLYFNQRFLSGDLVLEKISVDSDAALLLNKIHQTSTRNSIKEWTLDASSARLLKDENQAQMNDVRVVFFTDNARQIHLSSTRGILDTKTQDMTFSDNVVVTYAPYTLKTAELHYDKKRHILYSTVHISIMDRESSLEADTMETDLNKNIIRLRGNVKGTFSETFDFFSSMGGDS